MKIDYSGKTIVVNGAGGSIGRASATLFALLGGSVVASDISEGSLKETAAEIEHAGGVVETIVADVTAPDQAAGIVRRACDRFGGIDVLYNNAGGSFPTPMEQIDREEHSRIRALNFDAVYHASMEALFSLVTVVGMCSTGIGHSKPGIRKVLRCFETHFRNEWNPAKMLRRVFCDSFRRASQ